jgi:hypothetical protein
VRPRSWTDQQLIRAVKGDHRHAPARSKQEVTDRLGLRQGGPTNQVISNACDRLGLTLPNRLHQQREERLLGLLEEAADLRRRLRGVA